MIRYKKLGYVALNVTDVQKSSTFYEKMIGLQCVGEGENGTVFFRCSSDHHNLILYPSNEPGLKRIGFEVENPAELEKAFHYLTEKGLQPKEVDKKELKELRQGRSIRFQDPIVGLTIELYSDIQQSRPFEPTVAQIARLGHVVLQVKEFEQMITFLTETLNFKVSDYIEGYFAFMRCFPNPYHHSFAIVNSNQNVLHHVNFMVTDINDIGKSRNRMIQNDIPIVFGPGRHAPSESIFLYFLDPDGMSMEYSFGMEEFQELNARKPRMLEKSLEILDTWGGKPDPKLGEVGTIEQLQ